jgi:isopentenyl diphosphate isomerase/L-lactate dehydrogenase-like FMN-dependent dehydrogenase
LTNFTARDNRHELINKTMEQPMFKAATNIAAAQTARANSAAAAAAACQELVHCLEN